MHVGFFFQLRPSPIYLVQNSIHGEILAKFDPEILDSRSPRDPEFNSRSLKKWPERESQ